MQIYFLEVQISLYTVKYTRRRKDFLIQIISDFTVSLFYSLTVFSGEKCLKINIHVVSGSMYDAIESVFWQYQRFL